MNILLVDDQPFIADILAEDLRLEGHTLNRIGEPELLMDNLQENPPDLVLLDLYLQSPFLQGPEGWYLLAEIKAWSPDLPVIILTAYDSFLHDPRLTLADGYLIKGIDTSEKLKTLMMDIFGTEAGGPLDPGVIYENNPRGGH